MTAILTTLVDLASGSIDAPRGSLIADSSGDLFGTSDEEQGSEAGAVFEIPKSGGGYATTPTLIFSFEPKPFAVGLPDGAGPAGSLMVDADGDLFGTTVGGGANDDGTVFEIVQNCRRLRQHAHHAGQLQRR